MSRHVFIVMPFGEKEGINFNRVYLDLIKPAIESVGLESFRADEEILPGDIRADMFQELLMADLVIADLSINNPNAWYELGVRHALRARGIIQIRQSETRVPFDVCVDRTLKYHLKDGVPDSACLEEDRQRLGQVALETLQVWQGDVISPVYQYLPHLKEPDWKSLRVGNANEFWEELDRWQVRINIAQKNGRIGDILIFANEAPTNFLQVEAFRIAGDALLELGQYEYALEQIEKALAIDASDLESAHTKGIILGRAGKIKEAEAWLQDLLHQQTRKQSTNAETWALLGRVEKDYWIASWLRQETSEAMQKEASYNDAQLEESIRAYRQGFMIKPGHYYSGINALTLSRLKSHLLQDETEELHQQWHMLEGAIRWALYSELATEKPGDKNFWARITLADMEVLTGNVNTVQYAYKHAVIAGRGDWFKLDSSRQQLTILSRLGFRLEQVEMALSVVNRELDNLEAPRQEVMPEKIFLFSGHMIDAVDRVSPRFPADKEQAAIQAINNRLAELDAGPADLAICSAACGGDLLFAEACLKQQVRVDIHIPFDTPKFLERSVNFQKSESSQWQERFYKVLDHECSYLRIMPDELGPLPAKANSYERCNLWMLYSAMSWGTEKINFISLWDGEGGDGPGGTRHMVNAVKQRSGRVSILDTTRLFQEE